MRKRIIIALCTLIGIAAITAAVTFSQSPLAESLLRSSHMPFNKDAEPSELLEQYFDFINNKQYEYMYEMLSEQAKETISLDDFVSKNTKIYGGIEAQNVVIEIGQISAGNESEAVSKIVEYIVRMDTVAGKIMYSNKAVFTRNENKEYRMQWTTNTIFPNLNPDDRVRVNTLTAKRGCIYDRNGEMLAGPGVASAVGFVPGKMRLDEEAATVETAKPEPSTPEPVVDNNTPAPNGIGVSENEPVKVYNAEDITKVAELLETTPESIVKKLNASYVKDDTFVQLSIVSKEAIELKDELLTIPGILISDTTVRYYPLGEKASHLVGYIQGINAEELEVLREQGYHMNSILGKVGLEKLYENELRAIDGCEITIVNENGTVKETLARTEKVDGRDITLTIDAQMQIQLYDECAQDKSCSVAMNSKTGEILALVSTPAYNSNDFALGMSMSNWTALNEDENKPMYNRFKAALCPGSTFKAITAAIGIETGIVSPDDDFGVSGLRWQKDGSWGGYSITTTMEYSGPANIENALRFSDNIYFAKIALKIGAETFVDQLHKLGFEERIPFEFGLYSSIISSKETITSKIQLADSGFGQGEILTNPIHLASVYSSFVNGGNMIQPYLIRSDDAIPNYWIENAFSPETATIVRDSLIQVIESGNATEAKISGMLLGGKTGTAEIKQSQSDTNGTELGWFAMFTADDSAENPLLVITMIEDVKGRGGSHYVIPKVKAIFETLTRIGGPN